MVIDVYTDLNPEVAQAATRRCGGPSRRTFGPHPRRGPMVRTPTAKHVASSDSNTWRRPRRSVRRGSHRQGCGADRMSANVLTPTLSAGPRCSRSLRPGRHPDCPCKVVRWRDLEPEKVKTRPSEPAFPTSRKKLKEPRPAVSTVKTREGRERCLFHRATMVARPNDKGE